MSNPLALPSWSPYLAGAGIGILSWFAFATADHPIGVTTAFENTAAITTRAVAPSTEETNPYFADKAEEGKSPKINWEVTLVVGVLFGAAFSFWSARGVSPPIVSPLWAQRFGTSIPLRLTVAFLAGALMMIGARLAQGCTSGHGISGTLQLAVASWLFISVAFAVATATAWIAYGKEGRRYV